MRIRMKLSPLSVVFSAVVMSALVSPNAYASADMRESVQTAEARHDAGDNRRELVIPDFGLSSSSHESGGAPIAGAGGADFGAHPTLPVPGALAFGALAISAAAAAARRGRLRKDGPAADDQRTASRQD